MKKIIGFAGKMRSGKGVAAGCLNAHYGYEYVEMADKLKEVCVELLGLKSVIDLNIYKNNNYEIYVLFHEAFCEKVAKLTNVPIDYIRENCLGKEITTVRELLQFLGTDVLRKYDPQWHINYTIEKITKLISEGKNVAIADIRFPNEKLAIESIGGEVYYVERNRYSILSVHPSEQSLTIEDFDSEHIIYNDSEGNLDVFLYNVMDTLDKNHRYVFQKMINDRNTD